MCVYNLGILLQPAARHIPPLTNVTYNRRGKYLETAKAEADKKKDEERVAHISMLFIYFFR